jgi:DNA (cytosine-5)-methyltransferase 1
MASEIGIIDLFAGPGGLGEGFAMFQGERGGRPFQIHMSVEKEASAHKTLELRAFVRAFGNKPPAAYYQYLRGEISREELFLKYPAKAGQAREETLGGPQELGDKLGDTVIHQRLKKLKRTRKGPWVVIGGPPCQAYSLVGRARNRGVVGYSPEKDTRHFLYEEYLKVLASLEPDVFVMENVKGILSARVGGEAIFPRILDDLQNPCAALGRKRQGGPRYELYSLVNKPLPGCGNSGPDFIVHAKDYGVPQARQRVIVLGVKRGVGGTPSLLNRNNKVTTVGSILGGLPKVRSGLSKRVDSHRDWYRVLQNSERVVKKELNGLKLNTSKLKEAIESASRIETRGGRFVKSKTRYTGPEHLNDWLHDPDLGGFANHETRGHIEEDIERYLYCACFAQLNAGSSPHSKNFPESLAPNHANWSSGKFADRFKVQAQNLPASTITSHISKDGHYFIHYDPAQCRSLTVREAARLQTFPDNYFFDGNRTQQYVQVGNAVPPWLARQIAQVVFDLLEK